MAAGSMSCLRRGPLRESGRGSIVLGVALHSEAGNLDAGVAPHSEVGNSIVVVVLRLWPRGGLVDLWL